MSSLMLRAQFDRNQLPALCWYVDVELQTDRDGWQPPPPDAPQILPVPSNGYVDHEFFECRRGRRYGLCWLWKDG